MSTVLFVIVGLVLLFILVIVTTPFIDNSIRFASLLGKTTEELRKKYSTFRKESPENLYKLNTNNDIYVADYKLTMGGASNIYFEIENNIAKKILVVSKFDSEKWFKRIKQTYIENRKENHTIDDSLNYGAEIYHVEPKEYKSFLKKFYNPAKFHFGINHSKKFFMFFY